MEYSVLQKAATFCYEKYIRGFINDVLHDDWDDPCYSAVTLNNVIICVGELFDSLSMPSWHTVCECFTKLGFTKDDCSEFERRRSSEAVYYIGEQYTSFSLFFDKRRIEYALNHLQFYLSQQLDEYVFNKGYKSRLSTKELKSLIDSSGIVFRQFGWRSLTPKEFFKESDYSFYYYLRFKMEMTK